MRHGRFLILLLALLLTGCQTSLFPNPVTGMETPGATPTSAPVFGTQPAQSVTPTQATSPGSVPISFPLTLTVWAPPEYSPSSGTQAGQILQSRLDEFSGGQPGVQVKLRIKPATGPGGLLDALTAAYSAAPDAMPDLIALTSDDLEAAALKGMLTPVDGLISIQKDSDWYAFSRQMATLQDITYGLPFAGDALVLVSHNNPDAPLLADWQAVFHTASPLAFAAADRNALFTLAVYEGAGGPILDSQKRPLLSEEPLTTTLSFYQEGNKAGIFPEWLSDLETDDQVWKAFTDGKASIAITWSSNYLRNAHTNLVITPLPAGSQSSLTLARGWLWAISSPHPEKRAMAAKLAEFLSSSDFLAKWDSAAGYLPPRPSALAGWNGSSDQVLFNPILSSAQALPANDVLGSLGPLLKYATQRVIREHGDPLEISKETVEHIQQP